MKDEKDINKDLEVVQSVDGESDGFNYEELLEYVVKVWDKRKWVMKVCAIALVASIVVAFSIPKEYETTVTIAPEVNSTGSSRLSGLASLAGVNLGSASNGSDALGPLFYSNIVQSTPFMTDMFPMEVKDVKQEIDTTLYTYMFEEQSFPWWMYFVKIPLQAIGAVKALFAEEEEDDGILDPQHLSKDETDVVTALTERISVDYSEGDVTTITVKMQSPLICAQVADSVLSKIQKYITAYRTDKARKDLEYTQKMYDEAKVDYEARQAEYAKYVDANQNIILQSFRTEQERLQNERNLAYSVYSSVAQQLQAAKMKVQETQPVLAVIQPATVPVLPSSPRKVIIVIAFLFLAFAGASAWIIVGKDAWNNVMQRLKTPKTIE